MGAPRRIRLRRTRGWRKPEGAVVVARPSRWGNPFPPTEHGRAGAVARHRAWLMEQPELLAEVRRELRDRDLACWCPEDGPCHADTLLEVANSPS